MAEPGRSPCGARAEPGRSPSHKKWSGGGGLEKKGVLVENEAVKITISIKKKK
jgi:hypothetical protein